MPRSWALAAILVLAAGAAGAHALKVCIPSNPFPPISFPDHEGQGQWLVRKAVERQGGTVSYEAVPWPRCVKGVQTGDYDAAIPPTVTLAASIALPMRDEKTVDDTKALGNTNMVVLRRVGSKPGWDGRSFSGLSTPVIFNRGIVSIRDKLAALGVAGDEGAQPNESMLQKLLRGRGELLIMNGNAALVELADAEYAGKLEILPEPFIVMTGHLGFNKSYYLANRAFVEAVWSGIARLRNSAEWQSVAPALAK